MQLFTIGLYELELDGTMRLSRSGEPVPTYGQSDVSNLARVFTGWDFDMRGDVPHPYVGRMVPGTAYTRKPMSLNQSLHSTLDKTFLGVTINGSTPGKQALQIALDTLANHPNVAPFFCRQLIQRYVTSNPSPAYVRRVAEAFRASAGRLGVALRAVLLDPEARASANLLHPTWGKLREPVHRFVQWARTFGVKSANGLYEIGDLSTPNNPLLDGQHYIGQSPMRSPSVFNFFRPGYIPPSFAGSQLMAPEFQIVNETTVAVWVNYMHGAVMYGIRGDMLPNYQTEIGIAVDSGTLVNHLNLHLAAGQLAPSTVQRIKTALDALPVYSDSPDAGKRVRVAAAILMVICCPEYLCQK
jgi:uncharacterized protein (DUF1800 family)